jgi:hypothetical protein
MKLIGEKNSKNGIIKVFEALQDYRLNKHLFYVSPKSESLREVERHFFIIDFFVIFQDISGGFLARIVPANV